MQLRPEQLDAYHEKHGPASIFIISGDEPLQKMELMDRVRSQIKNAGYLERIILDVDKQFDWQSLQHESASISLFSEKKCLELRLGNQKPGKVGGKALQEYCENLPDDVILLVEVAYLNKQTRQTKWFKALEKCGVFIPIWGIDSHDLPGWIMQRVRQYNKNISMDAARLIADRVEGNMLAASQEIEKICLLVDTDDISSEDVIACISDSARFDVFNMISEAYSGNGYRVVKMLEGISQEGVDPAVVYGALSWDFRRLCSISYQHEITGIPLDKIFTRERIWDNQKKKAIKSVLQRFELSQLQQMLRKLVNIDRVLKGQNRIFVWDVLQSFLLAISGKMLHLGLNTTVHTRA